MNKINPGDANLPIGNLKKAAQESGAPGSGDPGAPGWHSRGYLPHFESAEAIQHVTFHLADSLPKDVLEQLEEELKTVPVEKQDLERRKRIESWIDAGHGSCILREPGIAGMVQDSLLFFDAQRYRLLAWVVMPNHVHVLFQPMNGYTVAKIVASWKKFTARKISDYRKAGNAIFESDSQETGALRNALSSTSGVERVWHREYWDRYIRNEQHLYQAIEYIHLNPVKSGLVAMAEDWPWSSAYAGNANLPIGAIKAAQESGDPGREQ